MHPVNRTFIVAVRAEQRSAVEEMNVPVALPQVHLNRIHLHPLHIEPLLQQRRFEPFAGKLDFGDDQDRHRGKRFAVNPDKFGQRPLHKLHIDGVCLVVEHEQGGIGDLGQHARHFGFSLAVSREAEIYEFKRNAAAQNVRIGHARSCRAASLRNRCPVYDHFLVIAVRKRRLDPRAGRDPDRYFLHTLIQREIQRNMPKLRLRELVQNDFIGQLRMVVACRGEILLVTGLPQINVEAALSVAGK